MSKGSKGLTPHQAKCVDVAQKILGYEFNDPNLLRVALSHPSASKYRNVNENYERLEFLGDSILGVIIANEVFTRFPDLEEGGLTRIKVALVSGASLSKVAGDLGLNKAIIFGDSEMGTKGRGLTSALENVFEAIVAALYLDGGIETARNWVLEVLGPHIDKDLANEPESPKSSLQEILQANRKKPEYQITDIIGPPHDRTFKAVVSVDGEEIGQGIGHSKKAAEVDAAIKALKLIEEHEAQEAGSQQGE